ncbi:MAG: thioesterase family protein [Clostridia bacterium]|nr:thioesterase family protein [Clostridia bacterium]
MLSKGLTGKYTTVVNEDNTARAMKSGELDVFATPAMIAAMEAASVDCVLSQLDEGESTVGTKIDAEHLSATPVGMTIKATATLEEIDGRRLVFSVIAEDDCTIIGRGTHERFIIQKEKFMSKANSKRGGGQGC